MKIENNEQEKEFKDGQKNERIEEIIKNGAYKECFEVVEKSYNLVFERSTKLDNKVSIILAFTGIIFGIALGLVDLEYSKIFPLNKERFAPILYYLVLVIIDLGLYVYCIIMYSQILVPKKYYSYNYRDVLRGQFHRKTKYELYRYLAAEYSNIVVANNEILEEQFEKLKRSLIFENIAVVLTVILFILKEFIN